MNLNETSIKLLGIIKKISFFREETNKALVFINEEMNKNIDKNKEKKLIEIKAKFNSFLEEINKEESLLKNNLRKFNLDSHYESLEAVEDFLKNSY